MTWGATTSRNPKRPQGSVGRAMYASQGLPLLSPGYLWRWLTNPRTREVRRMTRRGYKLEWGAGGPFWN